ncbi:MAG: 2-C-methyl-D-erythritol 2,4-cyclodiphosphate synthase [Clostridiales bacterium]|nr:2-C-methyl-D-erythritol 2,4-cyclodiphosphate synthase [Clostridiales bacterium]
MSGAVWAVVVAAGRGTRFGQPYNKVFHPLDGKSVLFRCMRALEESACFDGAVLVLSEQDKEAYRALIAGEGESPLIRARCTGGRTRQESVLNGLRLVPEDAEIVAIHDAARPFVTGRVIRETIESARRYGSGVPGRPIVDTVKLLDESGCAVETPPRERLCAVQTPQTFRLRDIRAAHERAQDEGFAATDDAALYEKYVGRVHIVMNEDCAVNIKVTTPRDLPERACVFRTGTGYDAHRLVEGRDLVLCGVTVPYEKGLLGHSDADVAVHALMDALLGAAALGDIGCHFPDSDMRYKGISSMRLLGRVMALLNERGFRPVNADVTIVAQRPKLRDYIPQMTRNLAEALELSEESVNVKATTTEGMGFEGEGQGISAQAAVLIEKKGCFL